MLVWFMESRVPLEIALKGDRELIYGATSEDEGRGAEAVVLPFQSYGTLGRHYTIED